MSFCCMNTEIELVEQFTVNEISNAKQFSLAGNVIYAYITSVYDGDTFTCVFKFHDIMYNTHIRMDGYDAPEIKPRLEIPNRDKIIQQAIETKNLLQNLILDKYVFINVLSNDKYGGRFIGSVKLNASDSDTINSIMLKSNLVNPYNGSTKKIFSFI